MPDDNKLPRSLSARWRRVLKAFQAGESQEAIEHHVAKATAETLRRTHGVPELPALGVQMYLAAATSYGADGSSRRTLPTYIPTRLARQAVDALSAVMKERLALTSPDTAALLLARRVVAGVAYAFGLDRMAPVLMGDGFDPVELRHRFEGIAQSNPLGELAEWLLAHPDGSGLRAPGRRRQSSPPLTSWMSTSRKCCEPGHLRLVIARRAFRFEWIGSRSAEVRGRHDVVGPRRRRPAVTRAARAGS